MLLVVLIKQSPHEYEPKNDRYNLGVSVSQVVFSIIKGTSTLTLAGEKSERMVAPPGSSEVPRNPLTRRDVSSTPANGIFLTKKLKN